MIGVEEIRGLVAEWGLREDVIEKDYVIGWVLWGISTSDELKGSWVFKGGTCLKKCYIETYRFSEDLDFSVLPDGPVKPEELSPIINRILERVHEESGIDFSIKPPAFKYFSDHHYTEGSIYYRGPRNIPTPSRIKLDITGKEKIVRPSVLRNVIHSYSDDLPGSAQVRCYAFDEIFAEKIRAMGQRSRPRDLYDIILLFRREDLQAEPKHIKTILEQKCAHKNIPVPTFDAIANSPNKDELIGEWKNMLGHQLQVLPPFEQFWEDLPKLFSWIEGKLISQPLAAVPSKTGEEVWTLPPTLWTSGTGVPLEPIRFAAINHLCVEIQYWKEKEGELVTRTIEPYSLRRNNEGRILLYTLKHDDKGTRAFFVDHIRSVKVTPIPFTPKYRVEFTSVGPIPSQPMATRTSSGLSVYSLGSRKITPRRQSHSFGTKYVFQCGMCQKRFTKSENNSTLRAHKNSWGTNCSGRTGFFVGYK